MTAEEFDQKINAIADDFIREATTLNKKWTSDIADLAQEGIDAGIPEHMLEASALAVLSRVAKAGMD